MSAEAKVQNSLQIRKTDSTTNVVQVDYQSRPTSFTVDVSGAKGPLPGSVSISASGTDIDLSQLTSPGMVHFMNQSAVDYVDLGVYEPATGTFYPLFELGPGESYVMKFSRNFGEEVSGTVTGTGTVATNNTLRARATLASAPVNLFVGAFER